MQAFWILASTVAVWMIAASFPQETIVAGGIGGVVCGGVLLVGAARRWRWIIDPPTHSMGIPLWPYALIRPERLGPNGYLRYHQATGIAMILGGLFFAAAATLGLGGLAAP